MKKFFKILQSIYLCVRFPFLYPRNRFSGKHEVNPHWLVKLSRKFYKQAYTKLTFGFKFYKDPQDCIETNKVIEHIGEYDVKVRLILNKFGYYLIKIESSYIDKPIIFRVSDYVAKEFIITGITSYINPILKLPYVVCHVHKNEVVDTNYGFPYENFQICINQFSKKIYDLINWIWKNIINRICFIPTHTELDAMPIGWRKSFGIQMCKDIKKVLQSNHYLYKYRITQIKEKFGILHWYDNGSPNGCVYKVVDKYEDISYHTCIICGKPATKLSKGWISPYCDNCIGTREYTTIIN